MITLGTIILVTCLIYVLGTAALGRLSITRSTNIYFRIAAIGIFSLPLIWFIRFNLSQPDYRFLFFDSLSHLSLGLLFAYFICLPDRALTLRLLVDVYQTGETGITLKELNSQFGLSLMIQSRLKQMQKGQILQLEPNGRIILLKKGRTIGNCILLGRKIFRISSAN